MLTRLLLPMVCSAACLGACASGPQPAPVAGSAAPHTVAGEPCTPGDRPPLTDGSRECGINGRVYSGDELRATGAQHVGDALTQVDTSVTPVH